MRMGACFSKWDCNSRLLADGQRLVTEDDDVNSLKSSEEYLEDTGGRGGNPSRAHGLTTSGLELL